VSSKGLAFAFRLADANGDGFVSPSEFLVFTLAFLTLVLALNDSVAHFSADYVSSMIDATTDSVVRKAFHEADLNRDGLLTWSEFSSWFKNGGHSLMPWVTLLQARPDASMEESSDDRGVAFDDDTNEIVFEFALAPTYGTLIVTKTDVDNLENLLLATRLFEKDPADVLQYFCDKANGDTLSKEAFDECIRTLAPDVASLRREDRSRISYVLNNIFFSFDRTGTRRVRLDEFCTGFSLLCAGSKSNKLQLTFSLFDLNGEGAVRPLDFARFLRSVLTVLFALNDAAASRTSFQVYEAIDRTTARALKMMIKGLTEVAPAGSPPAKVSFEDFASFYNTLSGNQLISFVELLDLSKFPFQDLKLDKGVSKYSLPALSSPSRSSDSVVFSFEMLPSPERFVVRASDAQRLRRVLAASGLASVPPERVHAAVNNLAQGQSTLPKAEYERLLAMFRKENAEVDDPKLTNYFFNNLFYAYDREGTSEEVKCAEIACGLSVLAAGKKSDKLAFGFAAFDSNEDGLLSSEELARFLRSFTTALYAMVQRGEEDGADPNRIWQIIDTTSLSLAADVVHSIGQGTRKVSFEQFAQWYGQGGYKSASFLELLDMGKWPSSIEDEDEFREEDFDNEDEPGGDADEKADEHMPVFLFALTKKHHLEVEKSDIEFVQALVISSGLNHVPCEDIVAALTSRADDLSVISEQSFLAALAGLSQAGSDPLMAKESFASLYEVCDREGLGCDYRDLLGVMFLCGGSKSTKLAHSWNAVDSDKDGDLTRSELFTMLRAFLAALHAFNYGANTASMDDMHHNIDDSSNVLAAKIFLSSRRKKKDTISFEEFAEFYSEGGGYRLAPWLELLNLGKFIGQEYEAQSTNTTSATSRQSSSKESSSSKRQSSSKEASDYNGNSGANGNARVVFAFKLVDDEDALIVTQGDIKMLRAIIENSKIGSIEAEQLVRLINEQVDEDGRLSEQGFGTFVGEHVLLGKDNHMDEFVAGALYQVFAAFDLQSEGYVEPVSFSVGLSLLASGSKSSKLSLGWAMFSRQVDDDEEVGVGPMSRGVLEEFFITLLTSISCFAGNCLDEDVIAFAASKAAERVFADLGGNEISFDEFASWYTGQGFEHLSWIELLAYPKWRLPENNVSSLPPSHL